MNEGIAFERSNRIHEDQVRMICQQIGITHAEFDELIENNRTEEDFEVIIDNTVVWIGDAYLERCEGIVGITMPLVRKTIQNPEARRDLSTPNSIEIYFVGRIPDSRDLLLVQVSRARFQHTRITFAFWIPERLVEEAPSIEPNILLQILANRVGVPVRIGNMQMNFYWNEDVRINDPRQAILSVDRLPEDHYSLMLLAPPREERGQRVRVIVAYMIDLAEYRRSLENTL